MTDDRSRPSPIELAHTPMGEVGPVAGQQPPGPYLEEEEGGEVDLRRYLAAVLRHKWLILLLVAVGTAGGYLASQRVSSEYVAQATIWIEQAGRSRDNTVDAGVIRTSQLLQSSAWVDLLKSYVVLDHVVVEEDLFLHPRNEEDEPLLAGLGLQDRFAPGTYRIRTDPAALRYTLETGNGQVIEQGSFGEPVGAETIGLDWKPNLAAFPADRPVQFRIEVPRQEAVKLGNRLRTQMDRTGNFLRLEYQGEDPEKTASVLNAVAERHIEVASELKRAKLDTLVSILEDQLRSAEEGLRNAELALEDFKIETATLPSDRSTPVAPGIQMTTNPAFGSFFNMKVELEQIRRERDALERAVTPERGVVSEALASVGAVQQSAELQQALSDLTAVRAELRALGARYTAEHESVQLATEELERLEQTTIPELVDDLVEELNTRIRELDSRIAAASGELQAIPPRAIEEARLARQVEIQGALYTTLEQRFQESSLAAASSIPDIRILDRAAVPKRPVRDQQAMILLMGMLGSLGLGIGGAVLRDRFDSRIRYPTEVTRGLGLAILGAVPNLKQRKTPKEHLTQVLEAFRSIRLNVTHAFGTAGTLTFTVSSPGPGDGKSFVASNLALSLADQGHRTLLIDGDTRRGTLHHLLDTDRKPGLTDYLNGSIGREALVRQTRFKGLDVIPSGKRVRQGPELLGSAGMRELLGSLKTEYDAVIVDSPPLGAGVDPFALGALTGNLLLVLRSGTTNRELAESKLELVHRLPIRILGAVLNGLPQNRQFGYGYYSYAYVPGYEAVDEDPVGEERPPLQVGGKVQA